MNISKYKKKLIFSIVALLLFLLFLLIGFKIWLYYSFNQQGNLLLFSRTGEKWKICEMTKGGFIVWSYELPKSLIKERFYCPCIQRLSNGNTLITESYPEHDIGVIYEINRQKKIVWKCDSLYKDNIFAYKLKGPVWALRIRNGNILVGDREHNKVIEVDKNRNIFWEWDYVCQDTSFTGKVSNVFRFIDGNTGVLIQKFEDQALVSYEYIEIEGDKKILKLINLNKVFAQPMGAQILPNKHILISYWPTGYDPYGVVELDSLNNIVWSFKLPDSVTVFDNPRYEDGRMPAPADIAFRISNGNTAVYSRLGIYLVSPDNKVLWCLKEPSVKSILGIRYIKQRGGGDSIEQLLSIID
ncbi:MAG: hypothetical protein V1890_03690 [Candidatus Zixiibacteriota bacterium]